MEKVRSSFGLDILEVKENANEDRDSPTTSQAVSIGKEFGNVRVSLDQSLDNSASTATVSTAITPNLNVDIDVGGAQSSGVGLTWIKRY